MSAPRCHVLQICKEVKRNLRTVKACSVHNRFKFAFIIPEIAQVLKITRYAVVYAKQSAFGSRFLVAVCGHGIIKNTAYHVVVMA